MKQIKRKKKRRTRQWQNFRCTVCGYIHEGENPPAACPVCKVGPEKVRKIWRRQQRLPEDTQEQRQRRT